MDFETELERVAQQYRDEGFAVLAHPDRDHLPSFAAGHNVDLLASRGEEHVLVQAKQDRSSLEADPSALQLAEVTNAQPGWRCDLVILGEGDPFRRITREAREPSNQEIDDSLAEVERLVQAGHLRAASVLAWATLEAAMRQVASEAELYMPKTLPGELLRTLYGNGLLTREEFDRLKQSFRLRSEIVHGLVPAPIDPTLIMALVRTTRRLLTGNPEAQSVAG